MNLATKLAQLIDAYSRCIETGNIEWRDRHEERIESLVKEHMPSGSGFDSGTYLDFDKSTGENLVFNTSFRHTNDSGMYDGWTDHEVIVTPSLMFGYSLRVTGKDKNGIKDYICECFHYSLGVEV